MNNKLLESYRVLGVAPGASMEEIKQAYRDLVKVWHPDRFGGDNDRLRQTASQKLTEINLAFEAIKREHRDPEASDSKQEYTGATGDDTDHREKDPSSADSVNDVGNRDEPSSGRARTEAEQNLGWSTHGKRRAVVLLTGMAVIGLIAWAVISNPRLIEYPPDSQRIPDEIILKREAPKGEYRLFYVDNNSGIYSRVLGQSDSRVEVAETGAGYCESFDLSPDGRTLAVTRTYDFDSWIETIDLDSGAVKRIPPDIGEGAMYATYSLDGEHLAFAIGELSEASGNIWMMATDGTGRKQLTSSGCDSVPSFSPTGDKVAYFSSRSGGNDLYVIDRNTLIEERLTKDIACYGSTPAFAPDGKAIAFLAGNFNDNRIYLIELSNKAIKEIEPQGGWIARPSEICFVPDGSAIVYSTFPSQGIHSLDLKSRETKVVVDSKKASSPVFAKIR